MIDPAAWAHIQDDLTQLRETLDKYKDQFLGLDFIEAAIGFVEFQITTAAQHKEDYGKKYGSTSFTSSGKITR